jgi:hypothetical protein
MIYISVTTSYTSYARSLASNTLRASNTLPYKQGSLRYHTAGTASAKREIPKLTRMAEGGDGGNFNNLNLPQYVNTSLSSLNLTKSDYYMNMPTTGESIEISSIYLNIDKVKGVYFSKDVKNVIFTFPENLSELYYYNAADVGDVGDVGDVADNSSKGMIYKISNNTRIQMKNLRKFVLQSFNNNIDGIIF